MSIILPKISVVTIVYNGVSFIGKTIQSVISQTYSNFEYIVIDGASMDGTMHIVQKYSNRINKIISEKDIGLYDAMNKGINSSTGDYVLFMNGGDCFADENVLKKVYENGNAADFIYGDVIVVVKNDRHYKKARNAKYKWYGMFTNHQSMIYKTEIIKNNELRYDLGYKIAADYKFTLEFLKYSESKKYMPFPLSVFDMNGISNTNKHLGLIETERARKEVLKYNKIHNFTIRMVLYSAKFLSEKLSFIYSYIRYK